MAWSVDFKAMTNVQRLQELSTINDAVRTLHRAVLNAQIATDAIEISDRAFATNWRGDLVADIDTGVHGQPPGVTAKAEALEAIFLP
jgi:hypothetical protein